MLRATGRLPRLARRPAQLLPGRSARGFASPASGPSSIVARYRPTLAARALVIGAAGVSSLALYEMVSAALRRVGGDDVRELVEWHCDWDLPVEEALDFEHLPDGAPEHRVVNAATRLRAEMDPRGKRRLLVFVRHAQPAQPAGGKEPLSAEGRRQAELTGQRLRALFDGKKGGQAIRGLYHSSAPEAKATAEIILGCLKGHSSPPLVETGLLNEGTPTMPSPRPAHLANVPEKELDMEGVRAEAAFRAFVWAPTGEELSQESVEVVIGHGNCLRYLACRAVQLPSQAWARLAVHHCTLTWLDVDCTGIVALRELGSSGHLPAELITYQ